MGSLIGFVEQRWDQKLFWAKVSGRPSITVSYPPVLKFSIAGLIMAAIHIAILAYTLAEIMAAGAADWTVYWRMFLALDFPVSLAVVPLTWIFPPSAAGPLSDFANFWWPLAVHGLLGTSWWYIVGMSIGEKVARRRARGADRSKRTD